MRNPFVLQGIIYTLMMVFIVPPFLGIKLPLLLSYSMHKTLHLLGVVMFLGHNIVSLFWAAKMEQTANPEMIRLSVRLFAWLDVLFTAGGLLLVFSNGFVMASVIGGPLAQSWIVMSLILAGVSSLPLVVILPKQIRLWGLCQKQGQEADEAILKCVDTQNSWLVLAMVAVFIIPYILIVWLMTAKPVLW